jgi:hypothetical protein
MPGARRAVAVDHRFQGAQLVLNAAGALEQVKSRTSSRQDVDRAGLD